MKKIIFLITIVLFGIGVIAQDRTVAISFSKDQSLLTYTGVTSDAVSATKDSFAITLAVNKEYPVQYYALLKVDTAAYIVGLAHATRITVRLQGKVFDAENWNTITSISYYGTADTSIVLSAASEPNSIITFDTTKIFGNGANAISTFLYDTTKVFGNGANANGTILYDTTKIYGRGANDISTTRFDTTTVMWNRFHSGGPTLGYITEKNRELYSATWTNKNRELYSASMLNKQRMLYYGTITNQSVSSYYRQFRILLIRSAGNGARVQYFDFKTYQRNY